MYKNVKYTKKHKNTEKVTSNSHTVRALIYFLLKRDTIASFQINDYYER